MYPKTVDVYSELANLYVKQNRNMDALPLFQKTVEHQPNLPRPWLQQGLIFLNCYDYPDAEQCLHKGIAYGPVYADDWSYMLGMTYFKWGKLALAEKDFVQAIKARDFRQDAERQLIEVRKELTKKSDSWIKSMDEYQFHANELNPYETLNENTKHYILLEKEDRSIFCPKCGITKTRGENICFYCHAPYDKVFGKKLNNADLKR